MPDTQGGSTHEGVRGQRIAVVTGGGSGMGRELVRQLVAEACNVSICDLAAEAMAETVRLCEAAGLPQGLRVTTHTADVSDFAQMERFRAEVADRLTIADIRNGDPAACTFLGAPISPPPQPSPVDAQKDLSDDFGLLLYEMDEILGEPTVPLLIRLGWLARDRQKDRAAVAHGLCRFFGHVLDMSRNARPWAGSLPPVTRTMR